MYFFWDYNDGFIIGKGGGGKFANGSDFRTLLVPSTSLILVYSEIEVRVIMSYTMWEEMRSDHQCYQQCVATLASAAGQYSLL